MSVEAAPMTGNSHTTTTGTGEVVDQGFRQGYELTPEELAAKYGSDTAHPEEDTSPFLDPFVSRNPEGLVMGGGQETQETSAEAPKGRSRLGLRDRLKNILYKTGDKVVQLPSSQEIKDGVTGAIKTAGRRTLDVGIDAAALGVVGAGIAANTVKSGANVVGNKIQSGADAIDRKINSAGESIDSGVEATKNWFEGKKETAIKRRAERLSAREQRKTEKSRVREAKLANLAELDAAEQRAKAELARIAKLRSAIIDAL